MSIKESVRDSINRHHHVRRLFVAFCARFSMRLFAVQRFLSWEDLMGKLRTAAWRWALRLTERLPLEKIEITQGRAIFRYAEGNAFNVSRDKHSHSGSLLLNPEYEKAETELLKKLVQPGWTAIDAGASFGWYAIHFSSWVGASGRVFAFEPVPLSFQELAANAALNQRQTAVTNLELIQAALGNSTGSLSLYVPGIEFGVGAASQFLDIGEKVAVTALRLDDFCRSRQLARVDMLKIDVEGGELNVLRGAEEILSRHQPLLLLEIVDVHCHRFGSSPEEIFDFLSARGYSGRFVDHRGTLRSYDPRQPYNGNYLFEPEGRVVIASSGRQPE